MLNRMYQLPFPTKGVAAVSLDSARFVVQEWWPTGGNFPKSKAKAATGVWTALEKMRTEVDPITGDLTPAARAARGVGSGTGGGSGGTGGSGGSGGGTGGSFHTGGSSSGTGGLGGSDSSTSGPTVGGGGTNGSFPGGAGQHLLPPPTRNVSFATGTKRGHDGFPINPAHQPDEITYDQLMGIGVSSEVSNVYSVPTRVWYDGDAAKLTQLRLDFQASRMRNRELCFTVYGGWKLLVNWPMTAKMGHGTTTEDLHFDTSIARELFADPNGVFDKFDQEGLKQMATRAGRNGAAEAFLDKLWATLVSRLTSGATATFFLQYALDILAGATTEPPQPDLVAGIFQQLHAAGTKVQGKLPFGNNQGPAATSHGVRSVVQLPEAERQERVDAQRRVVASGTPDSVLDMVATAISGSTGISFSDKHASYVKSCCQSLSSSKALQAFGESADGTGIVIKTTDNTSSFHVSMQIQCIFSCLDTRGNAPYLKTNLDEVKSTYQAVTGRQFSSTKFKFLNLLPTVTRPSDAALLKALKEVNDGMLDGSYDVYQSQAQDAIIYPWLRMGLVTMAVIESPNFDAGFISMLRTFCDGILRWSVAGAPLSSVVKAVAKFMMQAETEANQRTALAGRSATATADGSFRASTDLLVDIAQLDSYTRGQAVSANLLFRRQCEEFGLHVPGSKTVSSRGSSDDNIQKIVDRAVAAATKRKRDSGGGGGGGGDAAAGPKSGTGNAVGTHTSLRQCLMIPTAEATTELVLLRRSGAQKKSGAGKTTNQLTNRMHIPTWRTKYGSKTVGGKEVSLCWYHLHKKDGCVLPDGKECFHSHDHFPDDYGGKVFGELSQAEQERISDSVVKG